MKKVIILFGGNSGEHEVSVMSAKNVYQAIDKNKFEAKLIYQTKSGDFLRVNDFEKLTGETANLNDFKVDCIFPVMHGPNCEDGAMQGFLQTLGVKYVGSKILSSAICMDKDIQKQIARFNGIKVTDWIAIKKYEYENDRQNIFDKVAGLKYPVFVKPSNLGSSVGISKVKSESQLENAIKEAFEHDHKVIIEQGVAGREMEVAVLGINNNLTVSSPGEVVSLGGHEFYDYNAKYFDINGSKTFIPAQNISTQKIEEFKNISSKIYTLFECEGLSRIDYFLQEEGEIVLNELNTIPGFTNISMYPKLMEGSGIGYTDLITKLIELA